jgi:steroid delta-isomerase-like uncharacterized protein
MMVDERRAGVSRRETLMAGGVGLGLLAGLRVQGSLGQQDDVPEIVSTFLEGWRDLDPDKIAQTYAMDGRREDITSPVAFEGRDEIRLSLVAFFGAFEHAAVEHPDILAGPAPYAADTWIFTGNYVGILPGLPQGSGEALTIQGFTLIEIGNDQIERTVDYYDLYGIMLQLGAQPVPAATPVN